MGGDNEIQWLPNTKTVATATWLGYSGNTIKYWYDSHGNDEYFTLDDSNRTVNSWHLIFDMKNPQEITNSFVISVYFQVENTKYIQHHDIKIDQYTPQPEPVIIGDWGINKGSDPASFCPVPKTDLSTNNSISICLDYLYEIGDSSDKISAISNQLKADFTYFMNESVDNIAHAIILYKSVNSYNLNIKFAYNAQERLFSSAEIDGTIKYNLIVGSTEVAFHIDLHNYLFIGAFSANHANLSYNDPYNNNNGHKDYSGNITTGNCLGLSPLDNDSFYHFKINGGSGLINMEHTYCINAVKFIGIEDIGNAGNEAGIYVKSWYLKDIQTIYPIDLSPILTQTLTINNYWIPGDVDAFCDEDNGKGWNNKNVDSVDKFQLFDKCVGSEWRNIVIQYADGKSITLDYRQIFDKIWAWKDGNSVSINVFPSYYFYINDSWFYSYTSQNIIFNNSP